MFPDSRHAKTEVSRLVSVAGTTPTKVSTCPDKYNKDLLTHGPEVATFLDNFISHRGGNYQVFWVCVYVLEVLVQCAVSPFAGEVKVKPTG